MTNETIHSGTDLQDELLGLVHRIVTVPAREWFDSALHGVRSAADPVEILLTLSPMARRKLGRVSMEAADHSIQTDAGPVELRDWELGDAGRAVLVLEAARNVPPAGIVPTIYRAGDETERISMTRALPLFDNESALKALALETGRINSLALFSALALGNPFPAAHYTDHEFNQLVLKSLFMGLPIERIVRLSERTNPELSRMCEDYFGERTAAGRDVPADIWLALGPYASHSGEQLIRDYLQHENARHRHYAAIAQKQRAK